MHASSLAQLGRGRRNVIEFTYSKPHTQRSCRKVVYIRCARPDNPYEPIERAIQMINRVISMGEQSGWSQETTTSEQPAVTNTERWVQFGATKSSFVAIDPNDQQALDPTRDIKAYLELPVDQYSLLDPKWISREPDSSAFRFCIPMNELIGVDLRPEVMVTPEPDFQTGQVTLICTKAALGAPDIDKAFKLNLVAVISPRKLSRQLPGIIDPRNIPRPTHIPGRPVARLKRWAARARGKALPDLQQETDALPIDKKNIGFDSDDFEGVFVQGFDDQVPGFEVQPPLADNAAISGSSVGSEGALPLPEQQVFMSRDDDVDTDDIVTTYEIETSAEDDGASSSDAVGITVQMQSVPSTATGGILTLERKAASTSSSSQDVQKLHCRVNVTMAVKVPGVLKIVPNALLGYAGSLILKATLASTLPNFLELIATDYKRWRSEPDTRDISKGVGDMYSSIE